MKIKIESLRLVNFKALQNVTIKKIPSLAIFVGANGVGKTTLFSVFAFLKECLQSRSNIWRLRGTCIQRA